MTNVKEYTNRENAMKVFMTMMIVVLLMWGAQLQAQEAQKEKTSFDEVTSKLEKGGNFYLYFSTSNAMNAIEEKIISLKKAFFLTKNEDDSDSDSDPEADSESDNLSKGIDLFLDVFKKSGLQEISGLGISSIKTGKFYKNCVIVHHFPEKNQGHLWSIMGTASHKLDGLMFLPDNTVLAGFNDINSKLAWQWICDEIRKSGIESLQKGLDESLAKSKKDGIDYDMILSSLNGEIGFLMTLDKDKKTTIPVGRNLQAIPEPSLLFILKTKDEKIFELLENKLTNAQVPEQGFAKRADTPDYKSLILKSGIPFIPGPATIVQTKEYLLIGSSSMVIERALAVKAGKEKGLVETDEFKEISDGMSLSGNGFKYISPRIAETIAEIQKATIKKEISSSPEKTKIMEELFSSWTTFRFFAVSENTTEGFVFHCKSNVSVADIIVLQASIAPTAIMAGMLLPALGASREKAKRISCCSNLKQIGLGLRMYSQEHNEKFPELDGAAGLEVLRKEGYLETPSVYVCPSSKQKASKTTLSEDTVSYVYFGGFSESDSVDIPLAFDKPKNHRKYINVLFPDGHVQGYAGQFNTCGDLINFLKNENDISSEDYEKLMEKARLVDALSNLP